MLFLAPVILAAPFIAGAITQQNDIGAFRFVLGWSEARFGDGPAAVAFFYATNLGIPVLLAVIAAFTARGLPGRWFLVAWMVALFIVPNVVVVSAVEFDMNKYFQIMWIAVAMLAGWLLARWRNWAVVARPARLRALAVRSSRPGTCARTTSRSGCPRRRPPAGSRRTRPSARCSSPTTSSTARSTWPAGCGSRRSGRTSRTLATTRRRARADTKAVYCDGPDVAAERMATYGATYVLSSGGDPCDGAAGTDFGSSPLFETVYDADGVTVWRLVGS